MNHILPLKWSVFFTFVTLAIFISVAYVVHKSDLENGLSDIRTGKTKLIANDFDSICYVGKPEAVQIRKGLIIFIDRDRRKQYSFFPIPNSEFTHSDFQDWLEECDSIIKKPYLDYITVYRSPFSNKRINISR